MPETRAKNLVEGKILLCGYSFNFVSGTASIRKVCETAKILGAAGFVVAVESSYPGTKYDPVPVALPGILITDVSQTKELIDYYNSSTKRDWAGRPTGFQATASIVDGLAPILHNSAPQVALFSSRGADVKDFSFEDADVLKPDILAPGSLIWDAWAPNGTDEANYEGEGFAMVSGTSMATPHIAGIAALMKQKYPHWSPAAIKSALMTTANKVQQVYDFLEHIFYKFLLDPVTSFISLSAYVDYINFLCSMPCVDPHEVSSITSSQCNA
ncbi:hypothetical protein M5K25_023121 [Dendrobium thyrsiflorum]|uniref:Peptidase S8/S53 domain-containing protein n=1 Tax=Dendrobium thyrsiflorum TaxID=117978 RepID=A0ABD0U7F6_DENTH